MQPLGQSTEFQFEDLFLSSSGPTSLASSWGAPDSAAIANSQLETYGTTEEDIGDEQDYSDEEEVVEKEDAEENENGAALSPNGEESVCHLPLSLSLVSFC